MILKSRENSVSFKEITFPHLNEAPKYPRHIKLPALEGTYKFGTKKDSLKGSITNRNTIDDNNTKTPFIRSLASLFKTELAPSETERVNIEKNSPHSNSIILVQEYKIAALHQKPARLISNDYAKLKNGIYKSLYSKSPLIPEKPPQLYYDKQKQNVILSTASITNEYTQNVDASKTKAKNNPNQLKGLLEQKKENNEISYPSLQGYMEKILESIKGKEGVEEFFTCDEKKLLETTLHKISEINYPLFETIQSTLQQKVENRLAKIRKSMIEYLTKAKQSGVKNLLENVINDINPYFFEQSHEFFEEIKVGNYIGVVGCLIKNNKLVFTYDYIRMTGLHWAAKRNHNRICQLLIESKANINALDILGRNALHFAVQNENIDLVRFLLLHKANPWSTTQCSYFDLCNNNPMICTLIAKSRELHITIQMTPANSRKNMFEKKVSSYLLEKAFSIK